MNEDEILENTEIIEEEFTETYEEIVVDDTSGSETLVETDVFEEQEIIQEELTENYQEVIVDETTTTEPLMELNDYVEPYSETYTEIVVDNSEVVQVLMEIRDGLNIVVVFTIITFVTACLRGWRKNVVKGVR